MKSQGLESAYATTRYKVHSAKCNEAPIANELDRQFDNQEKHAVIVSGLTYVRVNYKWHNICILLDLHNRELIGHSAGAQKSADLVYDAYANVKVDLRDIQLFHNDEGSEFNNQLNNEMLDA